MFQLVSPEILSLASFGMLVLFIAFFTAKGFKIIQQSETMIIERLGRYHRTLSSGVHIIWPVLDEIRTIEWKFIVSDIDGKNIVRRDTTTKIDLRETVYDFPKQNVITRDNVAIEINAILYFQITDPKRSVYEIVNLPDALEKLTQTTLRNVIGELDLDQTLTSRDTVNRKLRTILDEATDKWGVKVNRVELQEITPPGDIQAAMEKQMRAERDRRAMILEAEGKKGAAILEAEGEYQARVTRARGEAEARQLFADAEAQAIQTVQKAVPNANPLPYLIAVNYIKALPEITKDKNGKLILVPYEKSALAGCFASIKELFAQKSE